MNKNKINWLALLKAIGTMFLILSLVIFGGSSVLFGILFWQNYPFALGSFLDSHPMPEFSSIVIYWAIFCYYLIPMILCFLLILGIKKFYTLYKKDDRIGEF